MSRLEQISRRKKKEEKKLEFEAGKVFNPSEAKEDLELDMDSARYKAQKGEGGDRKA